MIPGLTLGSLPQQLSAPVNGGMQQFQKWLTDMFSGMRQGGNGMAGGFGGAAGIGGLRPAAGGYSTGAPPAGPAPGMQTMTWPGLQQTPVAPPAAAPVPAAMTPAMPGGSFMDQVNAFKNQNRFDPHGGLRGSGDRASYQNPNAGLNFKGF